MSKNIIFCADGTWNGPGEPDSDDKAATPTNVFKTFLNLDGLDDAGTTRLAKEQERSLVGADGAPQQVAKYLHGVGDSDIFSSAHWAGRSEPVSSPALARLHVCFAQLRAGR